MAVGYLTSTSLIDSVKRRALIPSNQKTFVDNDFLALANEEIDLGLVPSILQYHEEYFTYEIAIPLVANQSNYLIPYRAIGGKFRHLCYIDGNNNLFQMSRINPEERIQFQNGSTSINTGLFYIRGNEIVMVPPTGPAVSGNLMFSVFLRPSDLVTEDRIGIITNIDTGTGIITFSNTTVPSNLTTGSLMDFLQVKSGHRILNFDIPITAVGTTTITVDPTNIPSSLVVGDHAASAGECMIPQIPSDLHSVLAQRVAARCLEALGDTQGLTNANTKLQEMEAKTGNLIDNRSEGNPKKINNLNSPLRQSMRRRRW